MKKEKSFSFIEFYEKFGIIFILVIEFIIFSLASANFLTIDNLFLVGRQVSFTGIAAVGMTMVLLMGEIDISVGSILAFTGCLSAELVVRYHMPLAVVFVIIIGVSAVFGLVSGTLTTVFKIPSLICTLAMQIIIKGFTYLMTGGSSISGLTDSYKFLGQGFILGIIPFPLIIMYHHFL